jgi:hypothetical protein
MNELNKVECLFLAGFSSLPIYLWVRPGAYPRVEHLKGASLGLPANHYKHLSIIERGNTKLESVFVHGEFFNASLIFGEKLMLSLVD